MSYRSCLCLSIVSNATVNKGIQRVLKMAISAFSSFGHVLSRIAGHRIVPLAAFYISLAKDRVPTSPYLAATSLSIGYQV